MVRTPSKRVRVTAVAFLLAFAPIYSVTAAPTVTEAQALSLAAGDYVWHPEASPQGEVEIVVSVPLQTAYVYRGGVLIGASTVSTGKPGHETPLGTYPILQKKKEHYSNLYDNAPMPFMQRLTWDGIALHAGQIPGYPASHGCIRLPHSFAKKLFDVTRLGATVHVIDTAPEEAAPLVLARSGTPAASGGTR